MMMVYSDQPSPEEEAILFKGLYEEAQRAKGMGPIEPLAFFIRDKNEAVLGGVKGSTYYGCLYIDSLWVSASLRGKGWGRRLMEASERLGKERKCTFASVNTMDWEALPFYEHLGYSIEYVRSGYEKDSKMYFLIKKL